MKYRLGDEEFIENTTIKVNGKYIKKPFSDDVFIGSIYIESYEFTNESSGFANQKSTLAETYFDKNGYGMYRYIKISSGSLENLMRGDIFMEDEFSMISMTIMEKDPLDSSLSGWNSEDGLMISAPAKTRQDALSISNSLMIDAFIKKPLK